MVRNAGRNLGGVELLGKFRNAASGKEGLETSEAVEIACGTRGFSNAVRERETQKRETKAF